MKNTLSSRLRSLRKEKKLKQIEVSVATNINRPFLSLMEQGKRKGTFENIVALADFYDVSLDFLAGRQSFPTLKKDENFIHDAQELKLLQIWRILTMIERQNLMADLAIVIGSRPSDFKHDFSPQHGEKSRQL